MLSEQVLILSLGNPYVKMDRREALLDAAERVLRKKGLVGATTRAITTEAGCAEGTLYLYFKGRAELFLAIFRRRLSAALPGITQLESERDAPDPYVLLLDAGLEFLRFQRQMGPLLSALFAEPALLRKYRALLLASGGDAPRAAPPLVAHLRREQNRKRIPRHVDVATATEALLGACFARAFHDNMFGVRPADADDRRFLTTLIRSLFG